MLVATSPGYAFAAFLHLFILVILSCISVARVVREHLNRPVEVRLVAATQVKAEPVAEPVAAVDEVAPPFPDAAEVDTDDPLQEALGTTIGHLEGQATAAFGLAGGGGAGRGGDRAGVGGSSQASDGAIRGALEWLKRHRTPDGAWGPLPRPCPSKKLPERGDPAYTALALLCYLCAGEGERQDGPYADVIRKAVEWLVSRITKDGLLRDHSWGMMHSGYQHPIVLLGLSEALARQPRSPGLQPAVERLVRGLELAQDPVGGGWRYSMQSQADTSVTAWAVLALKSAEHAGVKEQIVHTYVEKRDLRQARRFLSELRRRDPTCGGDEQRKRTLIDLTVRLEVMR